MPTAAIREARCATRAAADCPSTRCRPTGWYLGALGRRKLWHGPVPSCVGRAERPSYHARIGQRVLGMRSSAAGTARSGSGRGHPGQRDAGEIAEDGEVWPGGRRCARLPQRPGEDRRDDDRTAGCTAVTSAPSTRRLPADHRPQEGTDHQRAGKNMSPSNIRGHRQGALSVAGSVIAIGDNRRFVVALLTLTGGGGSYATRHGLRTTRRRLCTANLGGRRVRPHRGGETTALPGRAGEKFAVLPRCGSRAATSSPRPEAQAQADQREVPAPRSTSSTPDPRSGGASPALHRTDPG